MKTNAYATIALLSLILYSCSSTSYFYQVYKTESSENLTHSGSLIKYEDGNCTIAYNLWADGGDIGFSVYNKTDNNIFINKDECFFVLNGVSYNYYKNRIYSSTSSRGVTAAAMNSSSVGVSGFNNPWGLFRSNGQGAAVSASTSNGSSYSVSFVEEVKVCIPPKTTKDFSEHSVNSIPFRHCDITRYPGSKEIKPVSFTKDSTPLTFSNRISYSFGERSETRIVENEFYIKEITNFPKNKVTEKDYEVYCGKKSSELSEYFINPSPDQFYVRYSDSQITWIKL